jgi:hypothetical protein
LRGAREQGVWPAAGASGRGRRVLGSVAAALAVIALSVTAAAAPTTTVVRLSGRSITFGPTFRQGTIYLERGGEVFENPGFAFETGAETSGIGATGDLSIQTGAGRPYGLSGDLALLTGPGGSAPALAERTVQPTAGQWLVVLDALGRYVLVRIEQVAPQSLTFAYAFGEVAGAPSAALPRRIGVPGYAFAFPDRQYAGQVQLAQGGEVAVAAGFDFERDGQVNALQASPGLTVTPAAGGGLAVRADLVTVQNDAVRAWPQPASVAAATGAEYLLVDPAGNYVLLRITAVAPQSVRFAYRLLPYRAVPGRTGVA